MCVRRAVGRGETLCVCEREEAISLNGRKEARQFEWVEYAKLVVERERDMNVAIGADKWRR